MFFAKERCVFCDLLGLISRQKLKKRTEKNFAFSKRTEKNWTFWTEKNAVPNPAFVQWSRNSSNMRVFSNVSPSYKYSCLYSACHLQYIRHYNVWNLIFCHLSQAFCMSLVCHLSACNWSFTTLHFISACHKYVTFLHATFLSPFCMSLVCNLQYTVQCTYTRTCIYCMIFVCLLSAGHLYVSFLRAICL